MRLASIDIGTNTILMLISEIDRSGAFHIIDDRQIIARLGKDTDKERIISPEAFLRSLDALKSYCEIAKQNNCGAIVMRGTSALRDAKNSAEFIDAVRKETGIEIKVISGEEEASLTFMGTVSGFSEFSDETIFSVLDIGGGSAELIAGSRHSISSRTSLDVGSVRVTERFFTSAPPSQKQIDNAVSFINEHLQSLQALPPNNTLIGVAGTVTTLACLDLKLKAFNADLIDKRALSITKIKEIFSELKLMTHEQIAAFPCMTKGREDIILAGILILISVLEHLNILDIIVSTRGLRHGIALDYFLKKQNTTTSLSNKY